MRRSVSLTVEQDPEVTIESVQFVSNSSDISHSIANTFLV